MNTFSRFSLKKMFFLFLFLLFFFVFCFFTCGVNRLSRVLLGSEIFFIIHMQIEPDQTSHRSEYALNQAIKFIYILFYLLLIDSFFSSLFLHFCRGCTCHASSDTCNIDSIISPCIIHAKTCTMAHIRQYQ